jgi:transcriptional activator of cad operon
MRWQIAQFVFCDQQQTLVSATEVQQLEPMAVELLRYFCQNRDKIISIDMLIEHVWLNRIVTDNAVSKLITKLRKALNDDPRKPLFIATFPKKGYKFIAPVELLSALENNAILSQDTPQTPVLQKENITEKRQSNYYFWAFGFIIFVLAIGLGFINSNMTKQVQIITEVKALTRDGGREMAPRVSPDGQYLTYMRHGETLSLWIKSIATQEAIEVKHPELISPWLGPLSWNDEGNLVVYLVTTGDSCAYYLREFDGLQLQPAKLLHECPTGSYGKIAFIHDDHRFVYSASPGPNSAFLLYEFNQLTGESRLLPQPETVLGGNSLFDVHPTENKILISSPDKQQWEGFYSLNLDSDELRLLFKQDAYICCGIWDHTGTRVVLMGEHPAYQLISYDLKGNNPEIVYSGSQQLRSPERHSNGKDYLFVAGYNNFYVIRYILADATSTPIVSSSVDDRLAVYSAMKNSVAYVSVTSGNEEVWLVDANGTNPKKLTDFNDQRHYLELVWSADGAFLFGLTLNEIHKIDTNTGQTSKLNLAQIERRGLSVKDQRTIAYSQFINSRWQLTFYDLETNNTKLADIKWKYAQFTSDPDDTLWQDQNESIYVGAPPTLISDTDIMQQPMLSGRVFNIKKRGNQWVWQNIVNGQYQLMTKGIDGKVSHLFDTDSYHIDLSEIGILYHQIANDEADIYSTISR